ncbi:MAG: methionine adenosyltransferase [Promethearchaeota archaeon]
MKNILVGELKQPALEDQRMEICERKGIGHPDTICDAIMNDVSIELSKVYLRRFNDVLHHNIDKGLLAAGETETDFGGGKVTKPMLLVFGDRATFEVGTEKIPVEEITLRTAKDWFRNNIRFVDPEKHVNYQIELKRGSEALTDIFKRKGKFKGANDTSAAVGFAPMTETENIVLELERFLNSAKFKKDHPESGEDIKVMGLRKNNELFLTVAMAFVDRFVGSEDSYFKRKDEILEEIKEFVPPKISLEKVNYFLNTLDQRGRGKSGVYLTVLGTSADGADCGQVGRGNRPNGVIALNRPSSAEAAAGKNPVSHVGKIYNVVSYRIADQIYQRVPGIKEAYVWLLSQIGNPINEPLIASAQIILEEGGALDSISKEVANVVEDELDNIDKFCDDLAYGRVSVY